MIDKQFQILRRQMPYQAAYYYQKADAIYQLTYAFCKRFLPAHGDRTVDQMVQAARSGKQNIVEGTEDGVASTETNIRLLNVARASLQELREDYRDYLQSRSLNVWTSGHPRYNTMRDFCRRHNNAEDYEPFFDKWSEEEMANVGLTLCYMADTLLNSRLKALEQEFVTQGGIKERMHAARTGYRQEQDMELSRLRREVPLLRQENARLKAILDSHGIDY